jgi:hypothetical protein
MAIWRYILNWCVSEKRCRKVASSLEMKFYYASAMEGSLHVTVGSLSSSGQHEERGLLGCTKHVPEVSGDLIASILKVEE